MPALTAEVFLVTDNKSYADCCQTRPRKPAKDLMKYAKKSATQS